MGLDHLVDSLVFHDLRVVCVILVNVMTSSHLISSIILSISLFPDYMVPRQKVFVSFYRKNFIPKNPIKSTVLKLYT